MHRPALSLQAAVVASLVGILGGCHAGEAILTADGGMSCTVLCAWDNACPGAQERSCPGFCSQTAATNAASGCGDDYASYLACKNEHQAETCSETGASCVPAMVSYLGCVDGYTERLPPQLDAGVPLDGRTLDTGSPDGTDGGAPDAVWADASIATERITFEATIDGTGYLLEAMLYRPQDGAATHPLVVLTHGRNGPHPARKPDEVDDYAPLCQALAGQGYLVMMLVRRGYGGSEGPDSEFLGTAEESGLAGAQDVKGGVDYMRQQAEVQPDRIMLMGQSQGGWVTLAAATVPMEGVLGAVNISGAINFQETEGLDVRSAVNEGYLYGCSVSYGAGARVPVLWIYSENDNHLPDTVRAWFAGFRQAGGSGGVSIKPRYGTNGHLIVSEPGLYLDDLLDFFGAVGFVP